MILAEAVAALDRTRTRPEPPERHRGRSRRFYNSFAWRRLRFAVLAANAERNGGIAKCELCGASKHDGAVLNIDHVVPLSRDWSRRLDRANLQVLCGPCNHGKLNLSTDDFRPSRFCPGEPGVGTHSQAFANGGKL